MNAVAKLQPGCTHRRDRDVQPYRVLRDRCRADFAPIRWPHNDVHVITGDGVQLAVRDYDPPSRTQPVVAYDHRGHGDSSAASHGHPCHAAVE